MKEGWVKIFSSPQLLEVKLAEDVLKQNNVESHILEKPDSMLQPLGEAVLYVLPDRVDQAIKILRENNIE
ncbi:MAG: DUF2007 domain-containing protein [Saprospiraceae bacterium]|nr:DUF2007 domain-containing protein [Saprospiraceae bacterium]MCB9325559.1 DUF2007 domain-containing protein [Lewinellaceae bacterium]